MKKYIVTHLAEVTVEVEAFNDETALRKAEELWKDNVTSLAPNGSSSLINFRKKIFITPISAQHRPEGDVTNGTSQPD